MGLISRVSSRTYRNRFQKKSTMGMFNLRLLVKNPQQWMQITRTNWRQMAFLDKVHFTTVNFIGIYTLALCGNLAAEFAFKYRKTREIEAQINAENLAFQDRLRAMPENKGVLQEMPVPTHMEVAHKEELDRVFGEQEKQQQQQQQQEQE